jgi:outer membrane lipoprotein-sorting protein
MKKKILILLALGMMTPLYSQELTGEEIIQKVNDILSVESSHGTSKMTIITTSGKERTFVMESWSKNKGEKTLIRYLEPRRVKDQAVLMLNNADDIWMYFPKTQRVRKMATHAKKQKMQGSDFSYEDMGGGDEFITDFTAKRLKDKKIDKQDCYTIELTRKEDSDMSYSRLMLWVLKDNNLPVVIDYYDEKDPERRIKQLVQSDIEVIDGIPTAKKILMTNDNDNTNTMMEMVDIEYDVDLDDKMFTERGLKK